MNFLKLLVEVTDVAKVGSLHVLQFTNMFLMTERLGCVQGCAEQERRNCSAAPGQAGTAQPHRSGTLYDQIVSRVFNTIRASWNSM